MLSHSVLFALIAAVGIGLLSGIMGVGAYVRHQSLLGDVIAHAAFPGIAFSALWCVEPALWKLCVGGFLSGCIGALLARTIPLMSTIKQDAALGIILSSFFGAGLICLTYAQTCGTNRHAFIYKFIFGNAATITLHDIITVLFCLFFVLITLWCFARPLKTIPFDPVWCMVWGVKTWAWEFFFIVLQVLTIVIGLHIAGVLLMSSLMIAPAVASRFVVGSYEKMILFSAIIGICCALMGVYISSIVAGIPPGPAIVVCQSMVVMVCMGIFYTTQRKCHVVIS